MAQLLCFATKGSATDQLVQPPRLREADVNGRLGGDEFRVLETSQGHIEAQGDFAAVRIASVAAPQEQPVKLMHSITSPFVRRVRAAAIELGLADRIELEPVQVAPGRKNDAYAAQVNPLRKIPALVLDDGKTVLIDSTVICFYLDDLAGGGKLIPAAGPDRWRVLSQQAIAQGMCEAMVLIRYETSLRPEGLRWPDWISDQEDRFWTGLGWFEAHAEQALPSSRIDVSQLALACCLGYVDFRFADLNWATRAPRVNAWYQVIARRPSLAQTDPRAGTTTS